MYINLSDRLFNLGLEELLMERYTPLFTVALAFAAAIWSYPYYADYQYATAENHIKEAQKQAKETNEKKVIKVEARHILVKTIKEAEELRNRISKGEDFEKVAKELGI